MKNTKRFSMFAALALGLVIAVGTFLVPAISYANEHEEHKDGDHKDGDHKDGHDEHDGHDHEKH